MLSFYLQYSKGEKHWMELFLSAMRRVDRNESEKIQKMSRSTKGVRMYMVNLILKIVL